MIKPRTIVLTAMLGLPILVYVTVGLYAILQVGLFRWIWWLLPACWFLTWGLSRLWKPDSETNFDALPPSSHWTERDKSATRIVRRYQQRIDAIDMKQLADPHFFVDEMT